jgi:carbon-monoxide dehydrogenase medium subunit
VGDRPVRFRAAEDLLMSDDDGLSIARVAGAVACDPPDDVHASADYRRHLARILTGDVLGHALERTEGARQS